MIKRAETLPPLFRTLIEAAVCIPVGAGFGFLCGLAILSLNAYIGGEPIASDPSRWQSALVLAWTKGALLGAIYLPIAYVLFLSKERIVKVLIAIAVVTIFFGVVGTTVAGPFTPTLISASFGFWGACFSIYRYRRHSAAGAGFQSYFR